MASLVKRRSNKLSKLDDAQMYNVLRSYRLGITPEIIGKEYGMTAEEIQDIIYEELNGLNAMKASMKLVYKPHSMPALNKTETMNDKFLALVPDNAQAYAFYYAMSGSNEYALKESGLDVGLPKSLTTRTRRYALTCRGKYLRKIPEVRKYIEAIQEERLRDANVQKPKVQTELLLQIEEMKELAGEDPRYRGHLLKAIELLGKTIGAFEDRVKVEEASTKSGLELLMAKAKGEVEEVYELDEQQE